MSGDPDIAPAPESEQERLARLANLLFHAARQGDVGLLREATSAGAPPDLTNQNGDSLVMLAAYYGHAEAVEVLLQAGALVDQINDRGQTPLSGATFKGYADVVETLLRFGADPGGGSPPPVSVAVMFGREDLLALFEAQQRPRPDAGAEDGGTSGRG